MQWLYSILQFTLHSKIAQQHMTQSDTVFFSFHYITPSYPPTSWFCIDPPSN